MSTLKVNELDTKSGTTITVAAGKTLAGTDIIGAAQIATDAVTADAIAANAVDSSEIAAGAVTNAKTDFQPGTTFKGDGSSADGKITLNCSQNTHGVSIQSPAHASAASYTLTLPTTDGSADEFMQTDGAGVLTWAAAGGTNTPRFLAYNSTANNDISDATHTTVVFDTESIDSDSAFATNTFTVPADEAGTYYIVASSKLGASANGKYIDGSIRLRKTPDGGSASTIAFSGTSATSMTYGAGWTATDYGYYLYSSVEMVVTLAALDAIHVEVYSNNYSGTSRYYGGSDVITRFMGFKLL